MAKEKLLRALVFRLVIIISVILSTVVRANVCMSDSTVNQASKQDVELANKINEAVIKVSKEHSNLAKEIADQGRELALQNIIRKFKELKKESGEEWQVGELVELAELAEMDANLQIFVSQSMSLNLLRTYYKQAINYGGILVFKGLPEGSFKELTKLVIQISRGKDIGAMQIDDEAFEKFGISSVPTIVLSQESNCLFNQNCRLIYDKIIGNIGIRGALEKFAESGDLAKEARGLLEHKLISNEYYD